MNTCLCLHHDCWSQLWLYLLKIYSCMVVNLLQFPPLEQSKFQQHSDKKFSSFTSHMYLQAYFLWILYQYSKCKYNDHKAEFGDIYGLLFAMSLQQKVMQILKKTTDHFSLQGEWRLYDWLFQGLFKGLGALRHNLITWQRKPKVHRSNF